MARTKFVPTGVAHTSESFGAGPMIESARRCIALRDALEAAETALRNVRVWCRQGKSGEEIIELIRPAIDAASAALEVR